MDKRQRSSDFQLTINYLILTFLYQNPLSQIIFCFVVEKKEHEILLSHSRESGCQYSAHSLGLFGYFFYILIFSENICSSIPTTLTAIKNAEPFFELLLLFRPAIEPQILDATASALMIEHLANLWIYDVRLHCNSTNWLKWLSVENNKTYLRPRIRNMIFSRWKRFV